MIRRAVRERFLGPPREKRWRRLGRSGRRFGRIAAALLLAAGASACSRRADVVLYCAHDQEHAERIVRRFEEKTGLRVRTRFDTEASKTVGLVAALVEERDRPIADVFWNNEPLQTARLAQRGLLEPYVSPAAAELPARFRDPSGRWTGFAARARVFIVNTERLPDPKDWPRRTFDLLDERFKGRCAIARPLTGTTLTHFVILREVLGDEEFDRFLDGLFANDVRVLASNSATMRAVRDGEVWFAFTDTDDFHVAYSKGYPVACVFPDQEEGGLGTLLLPNTVSVVRGAPHPEAARALVDFLLSREVEAELARGKSAQIPLRPDVPPPPCEQILPLGSFRTMAWDPDRCARRLDETARLLRERFGG